MYKRGPRTYVQKDMLSKFPFETGINSLVLTHLTSEVEKIDPLDRYVSLSFDKMCLNSGLYYDPVKDQITGYEDLGHLG